MTPASASSPALIALDWGTTSLRAYLLDATGDPLEKKFAPLGVLKVSDSDFDAAFEQTCASWFNHGREAWPVLASGMIGSRQGWLEAPYVPCPAGVEQLAKKFVSLTPARGRRIAFVPGTSTENCAGVPDVIRGEETQIIGALEPESETRLFVLPGTHSKWARVEQQRITRFATFMTGEVFATLSERARSPLAADSCAFASASARLARACATSAAIVSTAKLANRWPRWTSSPTFTRTSVSRSPLASAPTLASCHAIMLPLAVSLIGKLAVVGRVVDTVSAGFTVAPGARFYCSPLATYCFANIAAPPAAKTAAATTTIRIILSFIVRSKRFIKSGGQKLRKLRVGFHRLTSILAARGGAALRLLPSPRRSGPAALPKCRWILAYPSVAA